MGFRRLRREMKPETAGGEKNRWLAPAVFSCVLKMPTGLLEERPLAGEEHL